MNIALAYRGVTGSEWDARLIAELTRRVEMSCVTLLLGLGSVATESRAAHLRRTVELRLAHAAALSLPLTSLACKKVKVIPARGEDVAALVRADSVDIVVDLGGAIDTSAIAQAAPAGVYQLWCDGVASELDCIAVRALPSHEIVITLLRAGWCRPRIVRRAVLTSMGAYVEFDRRNASARAIALLLRALGSRGTDAQDALEWWRGGQALPYSTTEELLVAATAVGAAVWRRVQRQWAREKSWFLAYRTNVAYFVANGRHSGGVGFRILDGGHYRSLADPCVLRHQGVDHVFMEEYPFDLGRGVISWSYLRPDGTLSQPERVLARPYHLSYPFVFEHAGDMWMVPESSANGTVDLYRAVDFPRKWEIRRTLLDCVNATDATLYYDGQRWWLFVSVGEQGSYTWDELFLYVADQPTGPWRPHPKNPVKSDPTSARPAGGLFRRGGVLFRPTQDCSRIYGGAVNLCTVDVLTETEFAEHVVDTIPLSWIPGAEALHTLSASQGLEVIDARQRLRYRWS